MKTRLWHDKNIASVFLCSTAFALISAPALQASNESSLIQYEYQRWNRAGLETTYPEDGPYVRVSASNTTYDRVLDRESDTQVLVYGYPLCGNGYDRRNLSASVGSGPASSGAELRDQWPWKLTLPRVDFDALDPAQQCNDSALDRSQSSGRPLQEILQEGFAVRIPRALKVSSRHTCEGRGSPSVRIVVVSSKIVSKRGRTGADSEVFRRTQKIGAGQVEPAT